MKAYYYLFYKLYRFWENISIPKFMSDWKAELSIDVIEIFLGLSGIAYYTIVSKKWIDFGNNKYIIFIYILFIALPNYFIFHHKDKWKKIVHEFDKWPERKNKIGGNNSLDCNNAFYYQFDSLILSHESSKLETL
ncbi:MAG TPA: hypothetical protein VGI43_01825 [Mucilaginibacter sp.]